MASQPPRRVLEPLAAPQHFVPPSARELRAQAVQRLQAGLAGLAGILLLVGLANVINDRARLADGGARPPANPASPSASAGAEDPLADIGVVPAASPNATPSASPAPAPAGAVRNH